MKLSVMEKYSQFRDRGKPTPPSDDCYSAFTFANRCYQPASGIAPFLPVVGRVQPLTLVLNLILFFVRIPFFTFALVTYFGIIQWLPVGSLGRKAALWAIAGIAGVWWVDLQVDGVKKG